MLHFSGVRKIEARPCIGRSKRVCIQEPIENAMKIRHLLMSILTSGLLTLGVGCRSPRGEQPLLGKWECTDLRKVEHISQFAKLVLEFRSDREVVSYMVDRKGKEIQREVKPYHVHRDILDFGKGSYHFQFIVKGNTLLLTVVRPSAEDDVGKTLEFRRRE